jgi:LmbE family N-acetylglucosaminyl deacetylase
MNPYLQLVTEYVRLTREARSYPLGGFPPAPRPELAPDAPKALLFSPHPDDECVTGALALRLRRAGVAVVNVAVTQGSNKARQAARLAELREGCRFLGYEVVQTRPNGLEKVSPRTRESDPATWQPMVQTIADILAEHRPKLISCPHQFDWNSTHIGTCFLVMDALRSLGQSLECLLLETEFWGQMTTPNLMVESTVEDVAELVTALSFHAGEVSRNPYHVLLPAWMQDNVRRGAELVGGQGAAAPDFDFATLYRLQRWNRGLMQSLYAGGRLLARTADAAELLRW